MPKKEQCCLQFLKQFNLVPFGLLTVISALVSFYLALLDEAVIL